MSDVLTLDPELEGLLREVAADPRSTLLRVPRRPVPAGVFDHDPRVTAMAAGLTSAERHLLQAHRAELAMLLRQGAVMVLHHDPTNDLWLDKHVSETARLELPTAYEWRKFVERALSQARTSEELTNVELVSACIDGSPAKCTATQLAAASLRLWPTDEARVDAGMDTYRSGSPVTALRIYRSVLEGTSRPIIRSCALQNMALAYSRLGQYLDASDASLAAAEERVEILEPILNAQFHALALGDRKRIARSAGRVDVEVADDSPVLDLFVSQLRQQRERGDWSLSPASKAAIQATSGLFRISSTKVVDATLQFA